ncbi:cytokinin riboside 5'-monophosphate phosphoribohydrolase LOG, partial [Thamnocephalis sphaerospora]
GGGKVISIIPQALADVSEKSFGEVHVTKDMHQRKALMNQLADAFITLPGGFGTFEELLEMTTWSQLTIHDKPVLVLDILGYYDSLFTFFDKACTEGFISKANRQIVTRCQQVDEVVQALTTYQVPSRTFKLVWTHGEEQTLV